MARFRNVSRLSKAGPHTIVGASGDMSDFQHIKHLLESVEIENVEADDGHTLTPKAVHTFLTRVLYNRCEERRVMAGVACGWLADGPALVPWLTLLRFSSLDIPLFFLSRTKMDPLWNTVVVGGLQNGQPFLGVTDKIGVAYVENTIATGYGAHIALVRLWGMSGARTGTCLFRSPPYPPSFFNPPFST
jgi:20S proteasome subunit beta 7